MARPDEVEVAEAMREAKTGEEVDERGSLFILDTNEEEK